MLSVVIQAGGESKRMGVDKALLPFQDATLIERVIKRVQTISDEILVTTNKPEIYRFLGLPTFSDIILGRGALGGLYTALTVARHPLVCVVACDMAFVNADKLVAERDLLVSTNSDIVIPDTGKGLEPFHAIYRRSTCLPEIEISLQNGLWRVDAWFDRMILLRFTLEQIKLHDPEMLCFFNINTPEDLQVALKLSADKPHKELT